MEYSKEQKSAIEHNKGPMMVLAGPGSGKTLVITRRTKNLIEHCGVNPTKILVITFTKAAASEMRERFEKINDGQKCLVNFGTFHSIFYTILRYAYNYNANNILRDDVKYRFLQSMIERYNLTIEDEKEFIQGLESEISLVKGEMIDIAHYYSVNCADDIFRKIYADYENMLIRDRLIDFDDMLVKTYRLFTDYPDVLASWQEKFEYVLIDEFQDINRIQYEIVKLLVAKHNNLFIVGDDDQSIYRFRGAKPEIMLGFTNDYKATKVVTLANNYRCSKRIVSSAGRVVKNNKKRYPKDIYTDNEQGELVDIREFDNITNENMAVIEQMRKLTAQGNMLDQIAILYRTNTQPRALVEKLMEYNVPFKIKDSMPCIYDHWIAQNIITYIELSIGYGNATNKTEYEMDKAKFLKIANRPNRYISRDFLSRASASFSNLYSYYSDKQWMYDRINKLEYDLKMLQGMSPYMAITYIRNGVGYEEYLNDYAQYRRINVEELVEIMDELSETAKDYDTYEKWFEHIKKYREDMERKAKQRQDNKVPSVTLATFHGAKGLEFDTVFIIDANEGITPHHKSIKEEDIEEERRMFYVAMTRARHRLHIFYSKERYNKELTPSRFVGEIFVDKEDLQSGVKINHIIYGNGTILSVENGRLSVKFNRNSMIKVLDIDYCISSRIITIIEKGNDNNV